MRDTVLRDRDVRRQGAFYVTQAFDTFRLLFFGILPYLQCV